MPRAVRFLAWLVLIPAAWPADALAAGETTGAVAGYVFDPTGAPLSDVPLTIAGSALLQPVHRTTGSDGRFELDQLPPGSDYVIEIAVPGFTALRQVGIRVLLGQTTPVDFNLTVLTEAQAVQTFQIIEKANPVLNTQTAQTTTVITAEKAASTPSSMQTEGVPGQVAGTSFSNTPRTRGGLDRYSKFYIDGLDTTDITDGSVTGMVNFFAVENFEVITGGFDAQYNSLDMVENVVTKSGSNRFTYDVVLQGAPAFMTAQNAASLPSATYTGTLANTTAPAPQTSFYSPILTLGGPIVPDRLWFFASAQLNYTAKQTLLQSFYAPALENRPTTTISQVGRFKLTWQPTAADRFSLTLNYDHTTADNTTATPGVTDDAETRAERGGPMLIANYEHNFTDNLLFQLNTGVTYKMVNNDPEQVAYGPDGQLLAGHLDTVYGVNTVTSGRLAFGQDGNYLHESKTRFQFEPTLVGKIGSHQLKGGVQASYMLDTQAQGVLGVSRYTDHGGSCDPNDPTTFQYCYERTDFYAGVDANQNGFGPGGPLVTNASALTLGAFIQDRWNVTRRLTLIPGIRVDYGYLKGDPTSGPVPTLVGIGPRFSGTFDVFGDHKSLITAHAGRSNDVGNIFVAQHANPALLEVNTFFNGSTFPQCTANPATNDPTCTIAGGPAGRSFVPQASPPYVDEIQLGFDQEIAPQTALGLRGDYRYYGNMWVDQEVNRIWDPSGQKIVGYVNGIPESVLLSTTSPQAFRDYEGMDVWIEGTPGRWDLLASYTLSFSHGTVSDYFDGFEQNPRVDQFAYGYATGDRRHTFKGSIVYSAPFGLDLGLRLRYYTGAPVWETFPNPADPNLNWVRSPRGTGYTVNPRTGLPNFNDPTQWVEIRDPGAFEIDLEVRYDLGRALGLSQRLEVAGFLMDALNDYTAAKVSGAYNAKGFNKFGLATDRNGPLQAEVLLRFRN